LANGADAIIPVAEISEALALREQNPGVLLAGERNGLRIRADLAGGIDFDFGNSPREFTRERVRGKTLVLSTTNGSRALRACASARAVLACSFLNLNATVEYLQAQRSSHVLLVCSGTFDQASYEDVLGAGAVAASIWPGAGRPVADSANIARQIYERSQHDLMSAVAQSRNGRRLLEMPDLRDDVLWCLQRDTCPLVAKMEGAKLKLCEASAEEFRRAG
jgi:2-phosphosulfolactate phosphatase